MDVTDRAEPEVARRKTGRLQDKIAALQQRMEQLKSIEATDERLRRTNRYR